MTCLEVERVQKKRRVIVFLHYCVYARKARHAHFKGNIFNPLLHILIDSLNVYLYHGTRLAD